MIWPSTFAQESPKPWTLSQKVGQLFVLGFADQDFSQMAQPLHAIQPGGVILFRRNISTFHQVRELNQKIQNCLADHPALIMVDQEGGVVSRLRTHDPLPSALALGRLKAPQKVEALAYQTGELLRNLGFNTDLAPVLDLSSPAKMNFMGQRVFGDNPQAVTADALAFAQGLERAGVLPIAKHFPGHGGTTQDSHRELPIKRESMDQMKNFDLFPFREFAIRMPTAGFMVAHVAFPDVDPQSLPASYSPRILGQLLRQELKYDGLVITDDLEMSGANHAGALGDRAVAALKAGADMVMITWNQRLQAQAFERVLAAVQSGELPMARLEQSLARIQKAKQRFVHPLPPGASQALPGLVQKLENLTTEIARTHFQRATPEAVEKMEATHPSPHVTLYSADPGFVRFFKSGMRPNVEVLTPSLAMPLPTVDDKSVRIFYVTGPGSARLLRHLPADAKRQMIVINGAYPGLIGPPQNYLHIMDMWTAYPRAGQWMAELVRRALDKKVAAVP